MLVTSLPTAVTTPAKSVPSCGSRPSKDGYRPNVTRTSAKLMLEALTATSISLGAGWNPVERGEFDRLEIAGRANLQSHAVVLRIRQGGESLLGPQRAGEQPRGVPVAVSPGGLVLFRSAEQLARKLFGVGPVVEVDLRNPPIRILVADRAEQAA